MIAFFQQISNIIVSVISLVVHGFQMLISVLLTIVNALAFIMAAIATMPLFVASAITVSVSLAVILFLINRGAS